MRIRSLLFALLLAIPVFAQQQFTMTPSRGPVAGGTEVTFRGNFPGGNIQYQVTFGGATVSATRVNETTLVATTPPHPPGPATIHITEHDAVQITNLTFTFEGDVAAAFERLLLPVFIPQVLGAFGSDFRTHLTGRLVNESEADLWGLQPTCLILCPRNEFPITLTTQFPDLRDVDKSGTPGAFIYVANEDLNRIALNLRAYDASRSAENFGTELPIVRAREFVRHYSPIHLVGIPSDPRFRNTLRVYGYGEDGAILIVTIEGENVRTEKRLILPSQPDAYHPGYVELSDFPVNAGMLRVRIDVEVPNIGAEFPTSDRWAFVSVTNNDTQHITLVTPKP